MPISLGDFFESAPFANPVNPRPVTFTATCRSLVLPGGKKNPAKTTSAKVTAAFVFLGGEQSGIARVETRKALRERFPNEVTDDDDFNLELAYQMLFRVLYEWDAEHQKVGSPMFHDVDSLRELVIAREANRVLHEFNKYVADEHPETVEKKASQS